MTDLMKAGIKSLPLSEDVVSQIMLVNDSLLSLSIDDFLKLPELSKENKQLKQHLKAVSLEVNMTYINLND